MRAALAFGFAASIMAGSPCAFPAKSLAAEVQGEAVGPYPGTVSWQTDYSVHDLAARVKRAVEANGMAVTASIGNGDSGTVLLMVMRNADLGRVLKADPLAGMELPIRIYLIDDANHKATIVYRTPSSIFALYDNPALDSLSGELDQLFAKAIDEAIGR